MKITLLSVGNTNEEYLKNGIDIYAKRLKHYIPFNIEIIKDIKVKKAIDKETLKIKEGEQILKNIKAGEQLILLDETGKEFTSRKFAEFVEKKMYSTNQRLIFVVGGAYGFSPKFTKEQHTKSHSLK